MFLKVCQRGLLLLGIILLTAFFFVQSERVDAQVPVIATTTITVSICGDLVVNAGEECDVPGETGAYSTTILGRQCTAQCFFGPYCGDNILQTIYNEQCDDGNNTSGDFCAADCTVEFSGAGGGASASGGGGSSGGSPTVRGGTQVKVNGLAYPLTTVNILHDGTVIGRVRTSSSGAFDFTDTIAPGAASFGFWALDRFNTRSATFNTTFDVTQGAVTNIEGIYIPPTIKISKTQINPGDSIVVSGQSVPNTIVEIEFGTSDKVEVTADANGDWSLAYDTSGLSIAEHLVKARFRIVTGGIAKKSGYSQSLQLFVGVAGRVTSNADLNRDGSVNLIDFSILVFWWGTNGGGSNPPADINGNGNVGIEDFSILLFNWTG